VFSACSGKFFKKEFKVLCNTSIESDTEFLCRYNNDILIAISDLQTCQSKNYFSQTFISNYLGCVNFNAVKMYFSANLNLPLDISFYEAFDKIEINYLAISQVLILSMPYNEIF